MFVLLLSLCAYGCMKFSKSRSPPVASTSQSHLSADVVFNRNGSVGNDLEKPPVNCVVDAVFLC